MLVPPQGEKGRTEAASGKRAVASRRGGRPLLSPLRAARPPPLPFALASFFETPVSAGGRARAKQQRGVSTRAPPNSAFKTPGRRSIGGSPALGSGISPIGFSGRAAASGVSSAVAAGRACPAFEFTPVASRAQRGASLAHELLNAAEASAARQLLAQR